MDNASLASAQDHKLTDVLALNGNSQPLENVHGAASRFSAEANEIGMTGAVGTVQRIGIVAGKGLLETPKGAIDSIEKQGVLGAATTLAESTAVGYGLKALMAKSAPIGKIAVLALGTAFVAKEIPEYYSAFNKGLSAKTWNEMDQASGKFGEATGGLAVDTVLGVAGFKMGVGVHNFRAGRAAVADATAAAESLLQGSPRTGQKTAIDEGLLAEISEHTKSEAGMRGDKDAVRVADELAEGAKATDAPLKKVMLSPEHTLSMKELYRTDRVKFEEVLDEYYAKLEKAFPDASEIESKDVYRDYLSDESFPWDMMVLRDKGGRVMGGIQSQTLEVGGAELKRAVWAEHIWLDPEARTYTNFNTLLKTAKNNWAKTGSDVVFMEFNDRAKMTLAEANADASAGLTPEAREKIWGRVGLYVLADEANIVAPYSQPAMGDGAPVTYLSMGIGPLKGSHLDGQGMLIRDYLKLMTTAHETIPGVDMKADPTILKYTSELQRMLDGGQERLSFHKLKDTQVARTVLNRFVKPSTPAEAIDPAGN